MVVNSAIRISLLLLLSPTSLAATNLIPHKPPARLLAQAPPSSPLQALSAIVIVAAGLCRPGELTCNAGCMPPRAECCPDGLGYCKQGYACVVDGCCPIGHTCSDEISCDLGEVPCGETLCMPEGAVCCSDGAYCHAGEECFQNGFEQYCQKGDGDGSTTTRGTKTGSIAETTTTTTTTRGQNTVSDTNGNIGFNFDVTTRYFFRPCLQHKLHDCNDSISSISPRSIINLVACHDDHLIYLFFSNRAINSNFNKRRE